MTEGRSGRRATARVRRAAAALWGGGKGRVLLSLAVGWLLVLGLRFALPALLPFIRADFGIQNTAAGVAITLIWGAYGLMQLPAGVLIDVVGERLLLTASLLVAGASLVAIAVAPVLALFLVGCVLFGLGTGLFGPSRSTVLARTYRENDRAAFGATLAAGSIGGALLPLVAGLLAAEAGWRATLWLFIPGCLLVGGALWRTVPPADRRAETHVSRREILGRVASVLGRRNLLLMFGAITLMLFAMQGLTAFLPTYLVEEKGMTPETATGLYTLLFLSGAVFQSVAGASADRFGDSRVLTLITGVSVLPLIGLPLLDGLLPLAAVAVAFGIRLGVMPVGNAYVVNRLPSDVQGTAWGFMRTLFFALGATGSVFVGYLADHGWFDESFFVLAAVTAVAAGLYWLVPDAGPDGEASA